jgi:hypothetical protein
MENQKVSLFFFSLLITTLNPSISHHMEKKYHPPQSSAISLKKAAKKLKRRLAKSTVTKTSFALSCMRRSNVWLTAREFGGIH